MLTLTHAFEYYKEQGGTLSYEQYREIAEEFNKMAVEELLKGHRIRLPARLGYIQIIRIHRSFKRPLVDWKASYDLKAKLEAEGKKLYDKETGKGEKWIVYFTDDYYFRYYWSKKNCKVRNKSVYRFVPTRGKVGAKDKLTALLKSDETAEFNFSDASDV